MESPDTLKLVDTTPISPTRGPPERRNSLEKHLQHRPEAEDLKARNILLNTDAAPALQAAQHELERQKITDSLRKGLEARPDKDSLVEKNILPGSNAAPALLASQRELERHMRADSLENKLKERPKLEELIKEGILEENENPLEN
ncbi:Serine-type carboxypeptidase F [Venturia nashicola]|uniref:Serine-type carboxypeptidase F n=1 Tax=Venturia nashicola TaxID=86259 RepID=A0A4Z1PCZ8_9PEZI|nr:Serine-type carboxypeptidase F [Venturia nashicola]TLD35806.1 Serine-type carboxypeptidase F [Venturia nashicola]